MKSIKRFFLRWFGRERQSDWLFPWEKDGEYTLCERQRMFEDIDN